jgi:hypothetical protein
MIIDLTEEEVKQVKRAIANREDRLRDALADYTADHPGREYAQKSIADTRKVLESVTRKINNGT